MGLFLTILRSKNHFLSAWKVPGSLASALASASEMSDLVSMQFEAKNLTSKVRVGQKWVRFWPFWGQKITFWVPGECLEAWQVHWQVSGKCLTLFQCTLKPKNGRKLVWDQNLTWKLTRKVKVGQKRDLFQAFWGLKLDWTWTRQLGDEPGLLWELKKVEMWPFGMLLEPPKRQKRAFSGKKRVVFPQKSMKFGLASAWKWLASALASAWGMPNLWLNKNSYLLRHRFTF